MTLFVLVQICRKQSNLLIIHFVLYFSDGLGLQKRIEYLSRAAINAKSCSQNASDGQLLDELEEKLEVCRLQIQVHEAMVALKQPELKPLCEKINSQLMDITTVNIQA